ncbi:1-phosphatidylinositol-4-phosphate 5-kinase [Malassezia cuniculi]|uniref:1-phosphatidylinositol-4-phosphate 5-kinase n=1 Tax=Malassezia cuniculi TaxID=948313 RepID=A0AAF0J9Y9_9BASI|nr:1-phosphatidylinositol-4-phosphate 5-kinase [Malassezia cuniculi]
MLLSAVSPQSEDGTRAAARGNSAVVSHRGGGSINDQLNLIRHALGAEEQLIRVNDSTTRQTYGVTLSRTAPYASPFVSSEDILEHNGARKRRWWSSNEQEKEQPSLWSYIPSFHRGDRGEDQELIVPDAPSVPESTQESSVNSNSSAQSPAMSEPAVQPPITMQSLSTLAPPATMAGGGTHTAQDALHIPVKRPPKAPTRPGLARQNSSQTVSTSSSVLPEHAPTFDEEMAHNADMLRRMRRAKERTSSSNDEKQHISPTRTERRDEEYAPAMMGNLIGEGHENYVLMYHMLTGIRIGVSRASARPRSPLMEADFQAKHKFTFDIIGKELSPNARYDFKFKDYAPAVFRELREFFRVDTADYLYSLTAKYILSELGSPGKSGSFFYFSRDYRFIIKTIRHSEKNFLMKILRSYYNHVCANPQTLLSQFYGLHRVKLPGGRKIHFVIMNNLFPPHRDIHETYDLKGSTVQREQKKTTKGAVLKDINWLKKGRHIELGPEKRTLFERQLKADVDLLQSLRIMDYSLLIGLHDLRIGNRDNLLNDALQVFQPEQSSAVEDEESPTSTNSRPCAVRRPSIRVSSDGTDRTTIHSQPSTTRRNSGSAEKNAPALRAAVMNSDPQTLSAQRATKLPNRTSERSHLIFYADEGGFRSTDEHNNPTSFIYYFGIIDLFTPYSPIKRTEHLAKGLRYGFHGISAVPPKEYAQRFVRFLTAQR